MNRVFRKVWNARLAAWVVASEFATGDAPARASGVDATRRGPLAAGILALFVSAACLPLAAQDFTVTDGTNPAQVGPEGSVTFRGDDNIGVRQTGTDGDAVIEITLDPDLAVDRVTTGATRLDTNGVAIGPNVVLGANGLTLGNGAPSITTAGIQAGNLAISGVARGTADNHAVNLAQLREVETQAAAGWNVTVGSTTRNIGPGGTMTVTGDSNVRVTLGGANDAASLQVGLAPDLTVTSLTAGATTVSNAGVAIGSAALGATGLTVTGGPSVTTAGIDAGAQRITNVADGLVEENSRQAVTGRQLYMLREELFADGIGVKYFHANSTAVDSVAEGQESIAIGPRTTSQGASSLAAGDGARTFEGAAAGVAIGQNARVGTPIEGNLRGGDGEASVAIGRNAYAAGNSGLVLGDGARVNTIFADHAIVIGSGAQANGPTSQQVMAIGRAATATGSSTTAIGHQASVSGVNTVALGSQAVAGGLETVAIGQQASAQGTSTVALGRNAAATGTGTLAIGDSARVESTSVTNALAIGTGARIEGAFASGALAVGHAARASGGNATAVGASAFASGADSVALGRATANSGSAIAVGTGAFGGSQDGIALGTGAGVGTAGNAGNDRTSHIAVGTRAGTGVIGNQTVALGYEAGSGVSGDYNIAIGPEAGSGITGDENVSIGFQANLGAGEIDRATAVGSSTRAERDGVAVGYNASATGVGGIAVGSEATAQADGVALGRNARASGGSVALGIGSWADATDAAGASFLTGQVSSAGTVVSVGDSGVGGRPALQRRIVNVADGAQAHDAVNVNQLRAAQLATADRISSTLSVNPDGTYGGYVIELLDTDGNTQRYTTVEGALRAVASDAVNVGLPANAVVYNADGSITLNGPATATNQAVNLGQLNAAIDQNTPRYYSINSSQPSNRDNMGATGVDAIAIGPQADADGESSLAVGHEARAQGDLSVALGYNVAALAAHTTAIGNGSQVYDEGGVAIGQRAVSRGENSVVIGTGARADRQTPEASVDNAVVIGTVAEVTAEDGMAIGTRALASGVRAAAHGVEALASAADAQASGTRAQARATSAQASGTDAHALGTNAIATGTNSRGLATNSVAIGTGAISGFSPLPGQESSNVNTIAIGNGAQATFRDATAVGRASRATNTAAAAFGDGATAGNVAALALGRNAAASGSQSIAQGDDARASGLSAIAQGTASRASAQGAAALGRGAQATQVAATAVGDDARAAGINATAVGTGTRANGQTSAAFGSGAQAQALNALALGALSNAAAEGASAVGSSAQATGLRSLALGQNAVAAHERSVALGDNAVTAAAVETESTEIDGRTYEYAGTAPIATVSMGRFEEERTLTHVAAGRVNAQSTDAVNGSQLFAAHQATEAVADDVDTLGTSVAGVLGGTSTYDANTHQVNAGLTVGGTSFQTVQGALTEAARGWTVSAQGANATAVGIESATGNSVDLRNVDGNIVVSKTTGNNDVVFDLADRIAVDRVTAGATVLDTTGVAVTGAAGRVARLTASGLTASVGASTVTIAPGSVAVGNGVHTSTLSANTLSVGGGFPVAVSGVDGTITGLQNRTFDPNNFTSGRAATEDQLAAVRNAVDAIDGGWIATDAEGNAAAIGPDGVVTFRGDGNVSVAQTGVDQAGEVTIRLNRDIDVDSVAVGDNVLDDTGLTVTDGAGNTSVVGAGTVAVTGNGGTTSIGGTAITVGGGVNPLVVNGATGTITGLSNRTLTDAGFADGSGRAATEEQLQLVNQAVNAGWTVTDAEGNDANIGPDGTVTFRGDGNIAVSQIGADQDGVVAVTLNRDLELDSVELGATRIDTTGVAIGPDVQLGNTGLVIQGGPSVTSAGIDAGGVTLRNVAAGVDTGDAVNVGQLNATIAENRTRYYGVNSTDGGNVDGEGATGDDAIASGKDAAAAGEAAVALGLGSRADGDGALALGAQSQALALNSLAIGAGALSSHANSIALGAGSATTVGARTGYQGAYVGSSDSTGELNVGGRQVTGIAAGSAATDAVNVAQLDAGVAQAVSQANDYTDSQVGAVNDRIDQLDGRVATIEGDLVDIRGDITDIQGDIVDIRGDITAVGDRVTNIEGAVSESGNRITQLENGASGPFRVSQGETYVAPVASGSNATAGGNGAVASGANGVAIGNQAVASGTGSTALGQGATASAADSTAIGHGATAGHGNSVALGAGSATTVGAQASYNAAYVGNSRSTGEVNVGGRTVSGVAPGVAGTDAVNVNQLNAGVNHALTAANQYTDGRIAQVEEDMWTINRGYRGATASAMAMAGLPQAYLPGKSMLSASFGGYQSEYGMAVGLSGITDNGRWVYRAQASGNTASEWGFSVGAGIQW